MLFSEKPCDADAIELSKKKSAGRSSATVHQSSTPGRAIDIEKFRSVSAEKADVIIEQVGPPAASYTHRGTEHWFYPTAILVDNGERTCPGLEDG